MSLATHGTSRGLPHTPSLLKRIGTETLLDLLPSTVSTCHVQLSCVSWSPDVAAVCAHALSCGACVRSGTIRCSLQPIHPTSLPGPVQVQSPQLATCCLPVHNRWHPSGPSRLLDVPEQHRLRILYIRVILHQQRLACRLAMLIHLANMQSGGH